MITKEDCLKEALNYKTKKDFKKNKPYLYRKSLLNGWANDICSHMKRPHPYNYKWSKEKCQEEALKYMTKKDFMIYSITDKEIARMSGWLEEICSHMIQTKKPKNYWTKEKCQEESLKYNNISDFSIKSQSAYCASKKNKWLDDVCNHMERRGDRFNKCIYVYEFFDNFAYIGLTYNLEKRQINRNNNKKDQVTKHIEKTGLIPIRKQLTDYIPVNDAIKMETYYVEKYKNDNWNILNVSKAGGLGGSHIKWTKEKCQCEALKYNYRNEFKINNKSAYFTSIKRGWLNDICSHMKFKYKQKIINFSEQQLDHR